MNSDDFEKQLKSQPWRELPSSWRQEILSTARDQAAPSRKASQAARRSLWREWFWPHPVAWGGVAAAWMMVLALQFLSSDSMELKRADSSPPISKPTPAAQMALAEQRKLRDELLGLAKSQNENAWSKGSPDPIESRPRSAIPSSWTNA